MRHENAKAAVDTAFVEQLIKRSTEADEVQWTLGRLRLQRVAQAAVDLYIEQQQGEHEHRK